jgi:hypothetical protein
MPGKKTVRHGLGPPACSDSELTYETVNPLDILVGILGWGGGGAVG